MLRAFGYAGAVVRAGGLYRLYAEYPIAAPDGQSPDQGPIALATAERPEGPWRKWEGNPVLAPGEPGAWDDGGYSESGVVYHEGRYHLFYHQYALRRPRPCPPTSRTRGAYPWLLPRRRQAKPCGWPVRHRPTQRAA